MQIGIGLPNQVRDVDPTQMPTWAARAEQAGFSTLATVGRLAYPGVMDTVALASAAGVTSRIGLLSGVFVAPAWPAELAAKELAGIDGVSGGRLTLGVGLGGWADDFGRPGLESRGRGARLDADLDVYPQVWSGAAINGSANPYVPAATRQIPILVGGSSPASFARAARIGVGYIAGSVPPPMLEPAFEAVRSQWTERGRDGSPRLVTIAYSSLTDPEAGRSCVHRYYATAGDEFAALVAQNVAGTTDELRQLADAFANMGVDEFMVNPAVADSAELDRVADALL